MCKILQCHLFLFTCWCASYYSVTCFSSLADVQVITVSLVFCKLLPTLHYHRSFVWCVFYTVVFFVAFLHVTRCIPCHYNSTSDMFLCLNFGSSRRWLFSGCQWLSSVVKMPEHEAHLSLASSAVTVCSETASPFLTSRRVYFVTLRETFGELCCVSHKNSSVVFQKMCSDIQGVSKRALQLWKRIEIYTEDIQNVLNCQNVAKHTEFYLG
jgi:hypothetical protein